VDSRRKRQTGRHNGIASDWELADRKARPLRPPSDRCGTICGETGASSRFEDHLTFVILESRITEMLMTLKPQDIVVLLKLLIAGGKRPTYAQLAVDLYMSASKVHASIRRARAARLIHGPEFGDRVNAKALEEFLVHGIKYAFSPEKGGMTRGMPTASAAEPLSHKMTQEEPVPVWPFEQGSKRGYAFVPLYKKAPQAALKDPELYQLLALVDAPARWERERARTSETRALHST